jgi:putative transposase
MKNVQEAMPQAKSAQLCRLFQVPRSSFYYRSTRQVEVHEAVTKTVEEMAGQWPKFGYLGLTGQMKYEQKLDPKGKPIGERRVKRALKELGLLKKPVVRKVRTTNSEHSLPRFENLVKDRVATCPDEIWASDITYISLGTGYVYLAVILDLFTRCIRGWHLSRSLEGDLTMIALKKAFDGEGAKDADTGCGTPGRAGRCPVIHHSDQGGQYAATAYVNLLESKGVLVSMAAVGCPEENGYAERWMRTLKEDHVQMSDYNDFWDAQAQIGVFIEEVYQRKRVHSKLGYLPPAVFEERWWKTRASEVLLSGGDDALVACPLPFPVAKIALPIRGENATIS